MEYSMGVLHSFSIKNIFYDKMDLSLFYFRVTICSLYWQEQYRVWVLLGDDFTTKYSKESRGVSGPYIYN